MKEITITKASLEDTSSLAKMAASIWWQYFVPIVGSEQVKYMLEKFQSENAMRHQMEDAGYEYYFLNYGGKPVGYASIKPYEDALFLSKIYVYVPFRGRGIAQKAIDFMVDYCQQRHLKKIWLTVNRKNLISIAIYEKMGFKTVRDQVTNIGNGFVMDDHVMEKPIEQKGTSIAE